MSTFPAAAVKTEDYDLALATLIERLKATAKGAEGQVSVDDKIKNLKALYESFIQKNEFNPGDVVRWKLGLKNRKNPEYNEPAIVVSILDDPIHDMTEESGSSYFRERLDIVIAVPRAEIGFSMFHFDSRRFEIWK